MPRYEVGHLDRIRELKAELQQVPTLALAGSAYGGAGIPDSIRSGQDAADVVLAALNR